MPRKGALALDDDDFPIAGYDTLRASQIIEQLPDLDLDELDMVQEREEQTKNRATVLRRVVERIEVLEAEEASSDVPEASAGADFPAATDDDFPAATDDDFPAAPAGGDDDFPIADYDRLTAAEIIAVLDDLEDDELDMVAEREEQGQNRVEILEYIDDMFEEVEDGAPEPAATPIPSPTTPRAAKKAPAKKAAVKKAAVKKAAAPVRKAAAKKVAAAKAAPAPPGPRGRAAGAKKAVASPGTKSAGRRTAAPTVKTTQARGAIKRAAKAAKAVTVKKAAATRKR